MGQSRVIEIPIRGMDCADCTRHVRKAIEDVPGVLSAEVLLASEKALVRLDPARADFQEIREAVARAGYLAESPEIRPQHSDAAARALTVFGLVSGAVLFVIVLGEWLGVLEAITSRVPWWVSLLVIITAGYPVFSDVLRATLAGRVISHTLMTLGVIAALLVGEWATAAVVVFFMRLGAFSERFTADRARTALKDLLSLSPEQARIEREGREVEVPIAEIRPGDVVMVRPGEKIPVDGKVVSGHAAVDQSLITGEGLPIDVEPGAPVFAATTVHGGSLRVEAERVGRASTFGQVVTIVEQAESRPSRVQRFADRFTAWFLPLVAAAAALTFLLRRDPMATVAVLVVACSCSVALATPIAVLASVGAAAKRGLLFKGGRTLETLANVDTVLLDKTGTLTRGRPEITRVFALPPFQESEVLRLAASAERYSEHPLAEAIRRAAFDKELTLADPSHFRAEPGIGVQAVVEGRRVFAGRQHGAAATNLSDAFSCALDDLQNRGASVIFVEIDGRLAGFLAAEDALRPEIPTAIGELRRLGIRKIELLTGDNTGAAAQVASTLGIDYRANLLPADKIRVVKEYQARGCVVAMVGDGVNDAPALKIADVGIAMGAGGSPVAVEAGDLSLLTDDWLQVPVAFQLARRTIRVVRSNLLFTAAYNLIGISLAAFGLLPPILAAAAQSLPDLGILANSSRLLRAPVR